MAKEEENKTVKEEENGVVIEEPVVDEEGEEENDIEDKVNSGRMKFVAIIVLSASFCVYFLFFRNGNKEDVVDNSAIVFNTEENGKVVRDDSFLNNQNVANNNNQNQNNQAGYETIKDMVPVISDDEIKIPDLPVLSNDLKNNIEDEISKEINKDKEKTFSKEEVDQLINDKLKLFEKQMDLMKKNNENMIAQFRDRENRMNRQFQEEKRKNDEALKEKDKEIKQLTSVASKTIVPPSSTTKTLNQNGKVVSTSTSISNRTLQANGEESIFDEVDGNGVDSAEEQEEQLKKQEEEIKIAQRNRVLAERKAAPIFKMQGGGGGEDADLERDSIVVLNKDLLVNIKNTESSVEATKVADLSRVIAQGKIIDAILESAIDTDGTAQIRAVITRDIYAEYGKNILIPKGSRAIGTFSSSTSNGIARVGIIWNRIIRVDGLSLNISANATDRIGRGGVAGDLDNKYLQIMRNSFLSSMVSVASSLAVEGITNSTGISNTTNGNSSTTTSGKASDYALIEATQDFMDDMEDVIDGMKEEQPTIRIPQGTKIIIMVNQDLTLPIYKKSK